MHYFPSLSCYQFKIIKSVVADILYFEAFPLSTKISFNLA